MEQRTRMWIMSVAAGVLALAAIAQAVDGRYLHALADVIFCAVLVASRHQPAAGAQSRGHVLFLLAAVAFVAFAAYFLLRAPS